MKTFDTDNTANIKGLGHTISSVLSIKVKVKQVCQLIMSFGQKKVHIKITSTYLLRDEIFEKLTWRDYRYTCI